MNAIKESILGKIEHLEALSEPVLLEVLDFVSFLEWRLNTNQRLSLTSSNLPEIEDTGSFLLGIASSFTSGLSNQDLECLPTDGAENHDRYLYNTQV